MRTCLQQVYIPDISHGGRRHEEKLITNVRPWLSGRLSFLTSGSFSIFVKIRVDVLPCPLWVVLYGAET